MDNLNFVQDGITKLPPGFRFLPTDEEIVFQYLARKIFSCPLPAIIIPEIINVFNYDPWDLPGDLEQDRYFFSNKQAKYMNGNIANRETNCGYWKTSGIDKQIKCLRRKSIMGIKKTLVFYRGKFPNGARRTDWIMHEYSLVSSVTTACNLQQDLTKNSLIQQVGNWALCRISLKKTSTIRNNNDSTIVVAQSRINHDLMMGDMGDLGPTYSCSSVSSSVGSSIITEVSSSEILDHDEEISSCNSLSSCRYRRSNP